MRRRGPPIHGLDLQKHDIDEDILVEQTIKSLQKKNILDKNRKIKKMGYLPILALELYKKAPVFMKINNLFVAVYDKQIVTIAEKDGVFDISMFETGMLMYFLLEQSEYLRSETVDDGYQIAFAPELQKKIIDSAECDEYYTVEMYENRELKTVRLYYVIGKLGYVYDLEAKTHRLLSPRGMRMSMMEDFGIETEEDESNGSN